MAKKGFRAPSTGTKARFAIRYNVVNGGPSGINSDYIGIDSLTLERPIIFPNNMQALSIITPVSNIPADGIAIAPTARFVNIGSNSLSNVNVSFNITGPVNYNNSKIIATISPGDSVTVKFDSTFVPAIGNYLAKAYSSLSNDTNRYNDTVKLNISALQTNYGSGAGYFSRIQLEQERLQCRSIACRILRQYESDCERTNRKARYFYGNK
ncbi:MAG: hypothetical protein IPG99_18955 [Ignavibacteria bacterium]|nr:hypothetical protein [Ignavibacteria bacterium]